MPRKRSGQERVLGPYYQRERDRYVVALVAADGRRTLSFYASEAEAALEARAMRKLIGSVPGRSIANALDLYEKHQREKGNRERSITTTRFRLERFFHDTDAELTRVTPAKAAALYEALLKREARKQSEDSPSRMLAVDTTRNTLAEAKTFLRWCVLKGWLPTNPLEKVVGKGKRHHRKPQLRIDEARRWLEQAVERAGKGDLGAVAASLTLLVGLRASEITGLTARDLDDDGRVLWVSEAKTQAGKRTLHVPEVLRGYLKAIAEKLQPGDLLFGQHWRDWPAENVRRICRLAKVPVINAHGMRGTFASLAVEVGVASQAVASALGHESFAVTSQSYAKPEALTKARQRQSLKVLSGGGPR